MQQGGGRAVDNLFWSEEHLKDWLDTNKAYKGLNHMPIRDFLKWIKERKE